MIWGGGEENLIYFFPGKAFRNLFYYQEGLLKFIFPKEASQRGISHDKP